MPILDRIEAKLDELTGRVLPKSALGKAVTYARNQWAALRRYTSDGRLTIDNNVSERTLRLQAIGRKNWEFLGSAEAGPRAAVLFTILAGAKRHRLEPWAYLRDVLLRLSAGETDLESLLPDRWAASHPEHVLQHRLDESRRKASRQKDSAAGASCDRRAEGVRTTDTEVEDRPGIGEGGRALPRRGAERRGRPLGSRHLDRRSRLAGPRTDYVSALLRALSSTEVDLEWLLPDVWIAAHPGHLLTHRREEAEAAAIARRRPRERRREKAPEHSRSPCDGCGAGLGVYGPRPRNRHAPGSCGDSPSRSSVRRRPPNPFEREPSEAPRTEGRFRPVGWSSGWWTRSAHPG